MKSYVETTFLQSGLDARGWAATLLEEKQGGQSSSDIDRARGGIKL